MVRRLTRMARPILAAAPAASGIVRQNKVAATMDPGLPCFANSGGLNGIMQMSTRDMITGIVPATTRARGSNDFAWAAKNRDRILAEWSKRYDAKSEPKK